jgi:hypothetical protein
VLFVKGQKKHYDFQCIVYNIYSLNSSAARHIARLSDDATEQMDRLRSTDYLY